MGGRGTGGRGVSMGGRGVGTTGESTLAGPVKRKMMTAKVDGNLCTGCGVCVPLCPVGAISMQGDGAYVDEDTCCGCGACEEDCPVGAIWLD